ncbi:unnamed protein product [Mytilus coruscus]|uniref:Tudor domain-containing protein n=1 Tax=Mytilus coruscus TaxID=42192 RepID=A0A6J8BEP7_MYTCO|nr:unnamed protein product [Mytilus coruscus]
MGCQQSRYEMSTLPIKASKKQARSAYIENEERKIKETPLAPGPDMIRQKERTEDKSENNALQNENQSIPRSGSCTPDEASMFTRSVVSQTRHSWPILSQEFGQEPFDIGADVLAYYRDDKAWYPAKILAKKHLDGTKKYLKTKASDKLSKSAIILSSISPLLHNRKLQDFPRFFDEKKNSTEHVVSEREKK